MTAESESEASRWARLKDVLGDVLLEEGAQRAASLHRICAQHPEFRSDIEDMLGLEPAAEGFLQGDTAGIPTAAMPVPAEGALIGGYRVKGTLGIGGSSIVYVAEQADPRRDVALKVLLEGRPSPGALQRFTLEAELLASLHHPAIAQVFEAGTSDQGRPWIAMELVQGAKPITQYATDAGLDRAQRIALLESVCAAISHGHRSGVIHRDVKPANLLVDRDGRARVIDFGVAKLQGMQAGTRATLPGSFLGTLAYMSPEQASGVAADVDTRSDVYSLGILAYELLCGELPYDLTGLSLADALEVVRSPQPRRPRELGVTGDLEAVLLHALEVDRNRRYATADELAQDLMHAQCGEPVRARAPSLAYFTRCFVRQHRLAVGIGVLTVLTVLGGAVGVGFQTARVEARERARAEQVKDFLLSVLALAVPGKQVEGDYPLSILLEDAGARIDKELSDNPAAAFEVHATIGKTWRDLGRYAEAEEHLLRAVQLASEVWGPNTPEVGIATNALADVLLEAGKFSAARARLQQGIEIFRSFEDTRVALAIARRKLAEAYLGEGELEAALTVARHALDEYVALFGAEHEATARGQQTLGRVLLARGDVSAAVHQFERALASDERRHGAGDLATARMRMQLALGLHAAGEVARAEQEEERAWPVLRASLPPEHPLLKGR